MLTTMIPFGKVLTTPPGTTQDAIAQNDIVVFSKSWCPHSKKSKTLASTFATEKSLKVIE